MRRVRAAQQAGLLFDDRRCSGHMRTNRVAGSTEEAAFSTR
jgi:hypothetical protein